MTYILHHSPHFYADSEDLQKYIAKKFPDARFIAEISIPVKNGGQSQNPAVVMYQENPPNGYSPYFALYRYPTEEMAALAGLPPGAAWVIVGLPDWNPVVAAILVESSPGEGFVTFSRFGHDFVESPVGDAFIDGGRGLTRVGGEALTIQLNLNTLTFERDGVTHHATIAL